MSPLVGLSLKRQHYSFGREELAEQPRISKETFEKYKEKEKGNLTVSFLR
jgi:hypothetical protein